MTFSEKFKQQGRVILSHRRNYRWPRGQNLAPLIHPREVDQEISIKQLLEQLDISEYRRKGRVDLRATARVRACREFLVDIIEQQQSLIAGLDSRYWKN